MTAPVAPQAKRDHSGVIVIALLTVIWGSNFFFTKVALNEFAPMPVATARLLIGAAVLTIIVFAMGQRLPMEIRLWKWLAPLGILNFGFPFMLMVWAQTTLSSSTASMFIASIPLFTLLFTRLILKTRVTGKRWFGFLIGTAGLTSLTLSTRHETIDLSVGMLPQLAMLLSAVCFGLSAIYIRKMPRIEPLPATATMLWFGAIAQLPLGGPQLVSDVGEVLANHLTSLSDPVTIAFIALIFLGVMPTGIGQAMRTFTIQRHGPVFFSIVNYLIPLWATMLGVVVLGETLTLPIVLAFAVVVIGLLLSHDGGFSTGPSSK
jgi:drug/metabolite transporter (DMT)-like permease